MRIGAMIERARRERGLSQREVAERTRGVLTNAGLSRIEAGSRYPSLRTLEALSEALNIRFVVQDGETTLHLRPDAPPDILNDCDVQAGKGES